MSDLIDREAVREFIKSYRNSTDVAFDMEKHLDEIPTASPWHRVEEELPKPNRNVLWWCEIRGMGHIRIGQYEGATNHGIPEVSCCGPACKPLYWMPLPEPPKEDA